MAFYSRAFTALFVLAAALAYGVDAAEVTVKGSLICNGACVPEPKEGEHGLVIFAIDGTPEIRAELDRIMKEFYPDKGLDADAAQKLMDQFTMRLKYHVDPASPALKDRKQGKGHDCMPATASAVTGTVSEKDGKKWIMATHIEATKLRFPDTMYAADKPFTTSDKVPITLKIDDKLSLKCVHI